MTFDEMIAAAADELPRLRQTTGRLFVILADANGRILPHRIILEQMGNEDASGVAWVVKRLRKQLPPEFKVECTHGIGYRLRVPDGWVAPWKRGNIHQAFPVCPGMSGNAAA